MTAFAAYYNHRFRAALQAVYAQGYRGHPHPDDDPATTVIQPRTLSVENPAIAAMSGADRTSLAVALYLTALVDQVAFTHFPLVYSRFRELTRYPKIRGDCPGGCSSMLHPAMALANVGKKPGHVGTDIPSSTLSALRDALPTLEAEVEDFCLRHLPALRGVLWAKCMEEPPLAAAAG